MAKFVDRYAFFNTFDGGGFPHLVESGIQEWDLPEDDTELREAFAAARATHDAHQKALAKLDEVARNSSRAPEARSAWHGRATG